MPFKTIGMLDTCRHDECNQDEVVDVSAVGTENECLTDSIGEDFTLYI
jgi:hypothetical protein